MHGEQLLPDLITPRSAARAHSQVWPAVGGRALLLNWVVAIVVAAAVQRLQASEASAPFQRTMSRL